MTAIQQLTRADLEESIRLSEFAFQLELSDQEREERLSKIDPEVLWGYFVNGRMAAKLALYPMETWIGGKQIAFGGIASVATWPEYRRQGMVAQLLVHAFRVMKDRGISLSTLHPFAFAFYRKYGYETYIERKAYELEVRQLPSFPSPEGSFHPSGEFDLPLLRQLYEAYALQFNGMMARDEEWWKSKIMKKKGRFTVYRDASGEAQGYLSYRIAERVMTVHEMVFINESARRAIWSFIRNHDSMIEKVKLLAPADDPLPFLLPDPRIKQEIQPYFMARIVDVERFASLYPFEATGSGRQLLVRIRDEHAPWNDGTFQLSVAGDGSASIRKLAEADGAAAETPEAALSCGIGMLTAMLLGYRRPSALHALGLLEGSPESVKALETVVPKRVPYLMDFF